jgi:hypothetical protein
MRCSPAASSLRLLSFLAVVSLLPVAQPAKRDRAVPADDTVTLPELTVTDSRMLPSLKSWRYARAGDFDVLSEAPDKTTRALLRDFQLFTQAIRFAADPASRIRFERLLAGLPAHRRTVNDTSKFPLAGRHQRITI